MSEAKVRAWRFYVDDMIACAEKVIAYADGFEQAGFVGSGLHYGAALRNLELIGEAATHLFGSRGLPARSLATGDRDPQSADPRLSRPRQRYSVDDHSRRCACAARTAAGD